MPFTHCVDAPRAHGSWYPPGSSDSLLGAAGSPWLLAAEVALEVSQKCPEAGRCSVGRGWTMGQADGLLSAPRAKAGGHILSSGTFPRRNIKVIKGSGFKRRSVFFKY